MRIPKIRKNRFSEASDPLNIVKDVNIGEFPDAVFELDYDLDDEKELEKYLKILKSYIRGSYEYRRMMNFLKTRRKMNRCFYLPNVKQYHGSKTKIEVHHAPFTMFEIIQTVIRKRYAEGESLLPTDISKEVMRLHYEGKVGLVSLSTTTHELIHSENVPQDLFVPIQHLDFGNPELFYQEYKAFMHMDLREKYRKIKKISEDIDDINKIVPDYLKVQRVYYKLDDNFSTQFPILSVAEEALAKVA